MRALSKAAKDWVLSMEKDDQADRRPTAHRLDLLRRAAESHIEYARSAAEVCSPKCAGVGRNFP